MSGVRAIQGTSFEVVSPQGRLGDVPASWQPEDVVFRGTYDEVLDYFDERLWLDGLPIVPPTRARVEEMLSRSPRDPHEVLGTVGDVGTEATVWNTAVNAVMAGCRDEDFLLVLALVEMLVDPQFRMRDGGSTTGWEILVMLSGAGLTDRGFNNETGVMRLGRRANTALGRFPRLWIRNVVGLQTPPGVTDQAAIGQSFHVAMAENEAATRAVGWPTLREECGYSTGDTVVAAQSVVGVSVPIYSAGSSADPHLALLATALAGTSAHFGGCGAGVGVRRWSPVLALNPVIAEVLAREGLSKDDVRAELARRANAPAWLLEAGLAGLGHTAPGFANRVADGDLPARYHESDDDERAVPVLPDPAELAVVVTGHPSRNQAKVYIPLSLAGKRMTRLVPQGSHEPT